MGRKRGRGNEGRLGSGLAGRVCPARLLLPAFLLSSPSLSFSPFSHFTPKRNGISSSTATATSLPDTKPSKLQYSQAAWCLGTSLRDYRTAFAWSPLQQRERQWQRAYRRRQTSLHNQEKNDRDRSTLISDYCVRVHSFRWLIPGKMWIPTNQIRDISARAHLYRELCARAVQASQGI